MILNWPTMSRSGVRVRGCYLVAPAATMTPLNAGFGFDRFGCGVLSRDQVRDQVRGHVADEFIRGDSVADECVCECCRPKFVASTITPALGSWFGGALSHGSQCA
jgi:hypothetical protein